MSRRINILYIILVGIFLWPAISYAEITVDANAPAERKPVLSTYEHSVRVDIQASSVRTIDDQKVSYNTFTKFDVDADGVVLNNDPGKNKLLKGEAADIIVIKVHSDGLSVFKGTIEVLGKKAHVIVSNDLGLEFNDCCLSNINKATLTTGGLGFNDVERLVGFKVTNNNIINMIGGGINSNASIMLLSYKQKFPSGLSNMRGSGSLLFGGIDMSSGHNVYDINGKVLEKLDK